MVEVASSNLAGPTKFLSLYFSSILFFVFTESSRVLASYLYLRKVVIGQLPCKSSDLPCQRLVKP